MRSTYNVAIGAEENAAVIYSFFAAHVQYGVSVWLFM